MITRRALARQEDSKLQVVLLELKKNQELCAKLNDEREDNEKEIVSVLDMNQKLKHDLSLLHKDFTDVAEERDRLQVLLHNSQECFALHDLALKRITTLEQELHDAKLNLAKSEEIYRRADLQETQCLYETLINDRSSSTDLGTSTAADPSKQECYQNQNMTSKFSNKSLKKYIRISKFIRKTQKLVKLNRLQLNKLHKKSNLKLKGKLDDYTTIIESIELKYKIDSEALQSTISNLQDSLTVVTSQYENSQKLINEYSVNLDEILKLSTYNAERFESLTNNQVVCNCIKSPMITNPVNLTYSAPENRVKSIKRVIMYSDNIGTGMGSLLNAYFKKQEVINNCFPFSSFDYVIRQISSDQQLDNNTTLLLFIGNRNNSNKEDLIKYYDMLSNLNIEKIILFTFPYCKQLPYYENDYRFKLNLTMHNLCAFNNKFTIIDINKCTLNYNFYKDSCNLSSSCKKQLAKSISYCIEMSVGSLTCNNAIKDAITSETNNLNCYISSVNDNLNLLN